MIPGHRNIHRDKLGSVLPEKLHGFLSVLRFRYHFKAAVGYDLSQHHSHERRIVHNHNFGHDNLPHANYSKRPTDMYNYYTRNWHLFHSPPF